jgi:hypothetical protein
VRRVANHRKLWVIMIKEATCLICLLTLFTGCSLPVRPDSSALAPWTAELRARQPDDAFCAVYTRGRNKLVFLGAAHTDEIGSLTFRIINDAYAAFDVRTVLVEGIARSRGPNDAKLLKWVASNSAREGRQEGGELAAAVQGALAEGAVVLGGEPDDSQIRDTLASQGIPPHDVLGFYTLRTVPQWLRERQIASLDDARIPALIDAELVRNRERLGLSATVLPDYASWSEWYARTNGKSFGVQFEPEETGPLADGRYGSNRIAAAISRSRDAFLLDTIAGRLNAGETVLVVFGGSHLMIQRPALDAMLGPPCYVGSDLSLAAASGCQ